MSRERTFMRTIGASLILGPVLAIAALLIPVAVSAAGPITSGACTTVGTTVTCDLEARPGPLTLPGTSTPIWGFAVAPGGSASVPGPVLIATSGDTVTVHLANFLPVRTSILFDGQPMVPDLTGVAAGASKTYTFTAGAPGTYLYEAGLLPGTQYQVAKGLYGALIVRPSGAPMQANADPASGFDDEALVVLGEVDTNLTASTTPDTFDLRGYAPRYLLINGAAYPQTSPITSASGHRLLLRYLDAGLQHHSMGVLGLRQTILDDDGSPLAQPRGMTAESIAPGQGLDVLVEVPTTSAPTTTYLLYDASLALNNSTGTGTNAGIGGMFTRIDAAGGGTIPDRGPTTSLVAIDPTTGALSAHLTDVNADDPIGSGVAAAEYFIDAVGGAGTGGSLAATFGGDPVDATATVPVASLSHGDHIVYVRGRDGSGNWGIVASAPFSTRSGGPLTTGAAVIPSSTNGSTGTLLAATADDRQTGASNIVAAEYFFDTQAGDGTGAAMLPSSSMSPIASLSATIPASAITPLAAGPHTIYIHSRDESGEWGPSATVVLFVDRTGPLTSAITVNPALNNGTLGINSTTPAVRVTGAFDDASPSTVTTGEIFIDLLGGPGTGIPMVPADGGFDTVHEGAFADVPLTTVAALSNGDHTIYVRGKDSAGNWGASGTAILTVDKLAPTVSAISLSRTAANAQPITVNATASDVATGNHDIVAAEYFIDTTGANGSGTAMTLATSAPSTGIVATIPGSRIAGLAAGTHTIYLHAKDRAGNWGVRVGVTFRIDRTAPTFSGITLTPNSIVIGTPTIGVTVNGASDGTTGSGVVGGEFWIGTTNITAGTGTAFTGTSATVPTASLTPGTYTVRVRIRDAAGNWSTGTTGVRTATLTVAVDAIFSDGFESGTLPGAWSSASTPTASRLSVTAAAALVGSRGLQAQGNATDYVQFNFGAGANPATPTFDTRFSFRPNGNVSNGQDIFSAATSNAFSTQVFRVRYRLNGTTPQVQVQVGTTTNNAWVSLTGGATTNVIEAVWRAAGTGGPDAGTLRLYVNGSPSQTLTTGSTSTIAAFRLGAVTSTGNSTLEYFDGFAAKRSGTPFGP